MFSNISYNKGKATATCLCRPDLMLRALKGSVFKQTVMNIMIGKVQGRHDSAWLRMLVP